MRAMSCQEMPPHAVVCHRVPFRQIARSRGLSRLWTSTTANYRLGWEMARKPYYTIAEFAKLLGVSTRTIQRRISSGDIQAVRVTYHTVRIPAEELKRLPPVVPTAVAA